jgi:hypothetical protein
VTTGAKEKPVVGPPLVAPHSAEWAQEKTWAPPKVTETWTSLITLRSSVCWPMLAFPLIGTEAKVNPDVKLVPGDGVLMTILVAVVADAGAAGTTTSAATITAPAAAARRRVRLTIDPNPLIPAADPRTRRPG